jgi:polar amino acid transport system substrate-binding protein
VRVLIAIVLALALVVVACGEDEEPESAAQSTPAANACEKDQLQTFKDGVLTVGTDKPAFPPYFIDDDPTNGQGFESAVAYAIARELGFSESEVEWTVVPFNASYRPGPKDFDFDVNQISITPQRARRVDFSEPYFTAPQAVVAAKGSPAADAAGLADLKGATIGVQIGTTSLDAVNASIQPSSQPKVFDDSNAVVTAIKQDQVDAVVVDLPTALFLTAVELPNASVVGQFDAPGGDEWGALLEKDSPLTPCVNEAIGTLRESGELEEITQQWMSESADAPVLQ